MPSAPSVTVAHKMWVDFGDWAVTSGVRIGIILVLAVVGHLIVRRAVPKSVALAIPDKSWFEDEPMDPDERARRIETVSHVFVRTVDAIILIVAVFLILGEIGVNLGPLIAGTGVAGIALGFGAQSLVKDVLSGTFIILEDRYRRGDVIRVAGVSGTVEDINLRRTVLRDLDGTVHSVPDGEIAVASNLTRLWSRVNFNVTVAYKEDLDNVKAIINQVGAALAADSAWAERIFEPPYVLRVDSFEESGIAIKVVAKVKPLTQWEVAGEFRTRLKARFDREGIQIPFPHRVIITQSPVTTEAGAGAPD